MSAIVNAQGKTFELDKTAVWDLIGLLVEGAMSRVGEEASTVGDWCRQRDEARGGSRGSGYPWLHDVHDVSEGTPVEVESLRVICDVLDLETKEFPFSVVIPPKPELSFHRFKVRSVQEMEDGLLMLAKFAADRQGSPEGDRFDFAIHYLITAARDVSISRRRAGGDA